MLRIAGGKERLLSLFADEALGGAPRPSPRSRRSKRRLVAGLAPPQDGDLPRARRRRAALPARPGVARLAAEAAGGGLADRRSPPRPGDESVRAIVEPRLPGGRGRATCGCSPGTSSSTRSRRRTSTLLRPGRAGPYARRSLRHRGLPPGAPGGAAAGRATIITPSTFTLGDDFAGAALVVDCLGDEGHPMRVLGSELPGEPVGTVTLAVVEEVIAWAASARRGRWDGRDWIGSGFPAASPAGPKKRL